MTKINKMITPALIAVIIIVMETSLFGQATSENVKFASNNAPLYLPVEGSNVGRLVFGKWYFSVTVDEKALEPAGLEDNTIGDF